MQYRTIGNSGISGSVVAFGAWAVGGWMWGGTEETEAVSAIRAAGDHGINLIDTAPMYGFGRSEEIVGKALRGDRDKWIVASKCGLIWDKADWPKGKGELHFYSDENGAVEKTGPDVYRIYKYLRPESIRREVEASLRRLGTDRIDILQTHWQDGTTPIDDTVEGLLKLKEEGKIRAIGCSNVSARQLEDYARGGALDVDQEKYSLLDREPETNGLFAGCQQYGVSFFAYSPLANGLLTGRIAPDRQYGEGDLRKSRPRFAPENVRRVNTALERLRPLAESHRIDIGQLIIAWTIAKYGKLHALCGARNAEQAIRNAAAGDVRLSSDDIDTIEEALPGL